MGWPDTSTPDSPTGGAAHDAAIGRAATFAQTATPWPADAATARPASDGTSWIVVGMGCFWGVEKLFRATPGVVDVTVGYAGGTTASPTYRQVCSGATGHAEVALVTYDPTVTDLYELLRVFWENHDPTQGHRQGNDVGSQYRSVLYTDTAADDLAARETAALFGERLARNGYGQITTEIARLADTPTGVVWPAEAEHQRYLEKNPGGYCPVHATGVSCQN